MLDNGYGILDSAYNHWCVGALSVSAIRFVIFFAAREHFMLFANSNYIVHCAS